MFLDEPFHRHTRSSDFIQEVLGREFEVTVEYHKSHSLTSSEEEALIARHAPDQVIAWQTHLLARTVRHLGLPYTWFPMFDESPTWTARGWCEAVLAKARVVTFSDAAARISERLGLETFRVRYYPQPKVDVPLKVEGHRVLIWYRGAIQPEETSVILDQLPPHKIVIKHDPDPELQRVARQDGDLASRVVRRVEGFLPLDEYLSMIQSCDIFVAPRRIEGIGLSFLEAMAQGLLVLAFDAPTMNEYIDHGVTGLLWPNHAVGQLREDDVWMMRQRSVDTVRTGHTRWKSDEQRLLNFIVEKGQGGSVSSVSVAIAQGIETVRDFKMLLKRSDR